MLRSHKCYRTLGPQPKDDGTYIEMHESLSAIRQPRVLDAVEISLYLFG